MTPQPPWAKVALPAGLALLVAFVAIVGSRMAVREDSRLSCLVEDDRSGGGSGLATWAEQIGFRPVPLRAPLWEADDELPRTGNVLITAGNDEWDPEQKVFPQEQWDRIQTWVEGGNLLVVMTSETWSLPTQLLTLFNARLPFEGGPTAAQWQPRSKQEKRSNKAPDVEIEAWWGGRLSVASDGPRLKRLPRSLHLAGDDDETVLAIQPVGAGGIVLLLDDRAWTNAGFDRADNAATLARLIRGHQGAEGVLAFDEYRHGYGKVESFMTYLLSLPGGSALAAMGLLLGVLWLWAANRRLGPADEFREVDRRTAREYIESVASMNQRARAASLATESVLQRVRFLALRKGQPLESQRRLVERAEEVIRAGRRPDPPREELQVVQQLIQVRRELYASRADSRAHRSDAPVAAAGVLRTT